MGYGRNLKNVLSCKKMGIETVMATPYNSSLDDCSFASPITRTLGSRTIDCTYPSLHKLVKCKLLEHPNWKLG